MIEVENAQKRCPYCQSEEVELYGKTAQKKQRYHCSVCHRTYIWEEKYNRVYRRRYWFELWIREGYSLRRLSQVSGYSASTLKRIKNYWLERSPEGNIRFSDIHYMIYDATYFHKDGCMLNLMDATNQKIIGTRYVNKESFKEVYPWFIDLKRQGLNPKYITTDGHRAILRAMRMVWSEAGLQRCLYHIQHEGMRWLRSHPKTEAGKELRGLLSKLSQTKTHKDRDEFLESYGDWLGIYQDYVRYLPRTTIAYKDLKRTMVLLNNAIPDMFYYLDDRNIHATTNALEGFHSRLKADYRRHRGLSKVHRISYLRWYCYFHNEYL